VSFGKREAPYCRRQCKRDEVMLAGSALALTRSRSVVVQDISEGGAALAGRDLPPSGDDLLMVVGPFDAMARVVWRTADQCGIRFDEPMQPELLAQMKQQASWASVCGWAS
jgi:hypothetical protein